MKPTWEALGVAVSFLAALWSAWSAHQADQWGGKLVSIQESLDLTSRMDVVVKVANARSAACFTTAAHYYGSGDKFSGEANFNKGREVSNCVKGKKIVANQRINLSDINGIAQCLSEADQKSPDDFSNNKTEKKTLSC